MSVTDCLCKDFIGGLFAVVLLLMPAMVWGLTPAEVVVVANRFAADSVNLARYYMEKRGIPRGNLILIDLKSSESCSREVYDEEIATPVRDFLRKKSRNDVRCLVTMFGVPLKVKPPPLMGDEKDRHWELKKEKEDTAKALKTISDAKGPEAGKLKDALARLEKELKTLDRSNQGAAVDSELSLVLNESYPLENWLPNPFFVGFKNQVLPFGKKSVLLVSRLDGPSEKIVRRIIDDSIAAEAHGLKGTAYFDARWAKPDKGNLKGYALYDNSLYLAADRVRLRGIPVVINDKPALFQAGEAPDAALYCGWYSLGKYVDAFDWQPGAIGYHIASDECATLRSGSSNVWCKRMLEDGVAATIGPVAEPYVQAFPVPEVFFGIVTEGKYSLVEAYFLSLPYLSWQMVLVGDPLYRPYKNRAIPEVSR
ncbi:MAG: TIGR03790 family protein [Geobacteraceae bacterium]|nr:TIGR03790 family protein [Geobacteraceae bacterium]